jgi:hypothetical protein
LFLANTSNTILIKNSLHIYETMLLSFRKQHKHVIKNTNSAE